jgi:hypothetical protein
MKEDRLNQELNHIDILYLPVFVNEKTAKYYILTAIILASMVK